MLKHVLKVLTWFLEVCAGVEEEKAVVLVHGRNFSRYPGPAYNLGIKRKLEIALIDSYNLGMKI